jgi:hypothetical protein
MKLIRIGYWSSETDSRWPDVNQFIDDGLTDGRDEVAHYLGRGFVTRAYMGYSACRICGENNGNQELTDGVYSWPEGLAHYVETHNIRLPIEFLQHLEARTIELEDSEVDDTWWRSLSATS